MHRSMRLAVVAVLVAGCPPSAPADGAAADSRPNVVVILADDLGFSDLGCYGGEIRTPHLDRLAAEGLRFSNFYTCGLCGPSRAALMTGLHPHQAGITDWTGVLDGRCTTLFELLSKAGYATIAVGRLDMVTTPGWREPKNLSRVLDRYLGTTAHKGPINYFTGVRIAADYRDGTPYSNPPAATAPTCSPISRWSASARLVVIDRSSCIWRIWHRIGLCRPDPPTSPCVASDTGASAGKAPAPPG